jgi:aminoglycoside phosphotransferase (APT) family kinase protein
MSDIQEQFSGTMPMREQHAFDVARLQRYMETHVEGFRGPLQVEQFRGGQSCPTYRLTAGSGRYVLRRKPPGKLLPSAHAVDREYRVVSALQGSGVPVAKTYALCEDESIVGNTFYIMEWVDGRIFWNPLLPELERADRRPVFTAMNQVMAALHKVDYRAVGLEEFGRPGNYFTRQISRWTKQYRASETERIEEMERLIAYLPGSIPASDETCVVHGDYRLDNMIFHASEPRVAAVLDWELSTLGHPLGDFTYNLMGWRIGGDLFRGVAGADLAGLGIPDEAEYVAEYCRLTGRDGIDNLDWYLAYNMFRLAAILQGIMGRALDGTASSEHALEQGRKAKPIAEMAWKQIEKQAG